MDVAVGAKKETFHNLARRESGEGDFSLHYQIDLSLSFPFVQEPTAYSLYQIPAAE